jgi:hypothetical protein
MNNTSRSSRGQGPEDLCQGIIGRALAKVSGAVLNTAVAAKTATISFLQAIYDATVLAEMQHVQGRGLHPDRTGRSMGLFRLLQVGIGGVIRLAPHHKTVHPGPSPGLLGRTWAVSSPPGSQAAVVDRL